MCFLNMWYIRHNLSHIWLGCNFRMTSLQTCNVWFSGIGLKHFFSYKTILIFIHFSKRRSSKFNKRSKRKQFWWIKPFLKMKFVDWWWYNTIKLGFLFTCIACLFFRCGVRAVSRRINSYVTIKMHYVIKNLVTPYFLVWEGPVVLIQ